MRDAAGRTLATAPIPAIAAPNDLLPKFTDLTLALPANTSIAGATIEIDSDHRLEEITTRNNAVKL